MITKKYKKSNIFNKTARAANNGSKYKKTRKMKGGGFFDFFKPKTNPGIQASETPPAPQASGDLLFVVPPFKSQVGNSQEIAEKIKNSQGIAEKIKMNPLLLEKTTKPATSLSSTHLKKSILVAAGVTLSTIVLEKLTDPKVLTVVTGIASTSIGLASGGAILVGIAVITAAWFVIKAKKKAYKGLILVMDELYLVLQKLSSIVSVSMHIAETYGFPIDTRDVDIAMNTIINKFEELLDPTTNTDYDEIKRNLSDLKQLKQRFNNEANSVINTVNNAQDGDDLNDPPKITLWTKIKTNIQKSSIVTSARQVITFSAPEFIGELNESVAYLALHVAALSSSFSITYTTVIVQLLVSGKMVDLKKLQEKVLDDSSFHSMMEAAFVIPLMQALKSHTTCVAKNTKNTFACDKNFVDAAESARLYMKGKLNNTESVGNVFFTKMKNLRNVVESSFRISSVDKATKFATAVNNAFENDKNNIYDVVVTSQPVLTTGDDNFSFGNDDDFFDSPEAVAEAKAAAEAKASAAAASKATAAGNNQM
jgi:hypothetical protein